jgi:hypothetical protein
MTLGAARCTSTDSRTSPRVSRLLRGSGFVNEQVPWRGYTRRTWRTRPGLVRGQHRSEAARDWCALRTRALAPTPGPDRLPLAASRACRRADYLEQEDLALMSVDAGGAEARCGGRWLPMAIARDD